MGAETVGQTGAATEGAMALAGKFHKMEHRGQAAGQAPGGSPQRHRSGHREHRLDRDNHGKPGNGNAPPRKTPAKDASEAA